MSNVRSGTVSITTTDTGLVVGQPVLREVTGDNTLSGRKLFGDPQKIDGKRAKELEEMRRQAEMPVVTDTIVTGISPRPLLTPGIITGSIPVFRNEQDGTYLLGKNGEVTAEDVVRAVESGSTSLQESVRDRWDEKVSLSQSAERFAQQSRDIREKMERRQQENAKIEENFKKIIQDGKGDSSTSQLLSTIKDLAIKIQTNKTQEEPAVGEKKVEEKKEEPKKEEKKYNIVDAFNELDSFNSVEAEKRLRAFITEMKLNMDTDITTVPEWTKDVTARTKRNMVEFFMTNSGYYPWVFMLFAKYLNISGVSVNRVLNMYAYKHRALVLKKTLTNDRNDALECYNCDIDPRVWFGPFVRAISISSDIIEALVDRVIELREHLDESNPIVQVSCGGRCECQIPINYTYNLMEVLVGEGFFVDTSENCPRIKHEDVVYTNLKQLTNKQVKLLTAR